MSAAPRSTERAQECAPVLIHRLAGSARNPESARALVRDALTPLPEETSVLAEELVAELVTRAVQCSENVILLQLRVNDGRVKVAVEDVALPHPPDGGRHNRATGPGLPLIDACAQSWGWDRTAGGTRVWFEI